MLQNQQTLSARLQLKVLGRSANKKERGFLVLFPCFPKNESSNHYKNHARYALNVIRRQYLACWVVGCQIGIAKQECGETYDNYSHYEIIDFHK